MASVVTQEVNLERVLRYENEGLLERLQEKLGLSQQEAEALFTDTKKFLFLCSTEEGVFGPSPQIDECWHMFILFTQDYAAFCDEYFGEFLHHNPRTKAQKAKGGGQIAPYTLEMAHKLFGPKLSSNWTYTKAQGANCSPSTNCQPAPCCR